MLATIALGLRLILRDCQKGDLSAFFLASFIGMAIEGLVVHTDHWRHFCLIMGVIWGMAALRPSLMQTQYRVRPERRD